MSRYHHGTLWAGQDRISAAHSGGGLTHLARHLVAARQRAFCAVARIHAHAAFTEHCGTGSTACRAELSEVLRCRHRCSATKRNRWVVKPLGVAIAEFLSLVEQKRTLASRHFLFNRPSRSETRRRPPAHWSSTNLGTYLGKNQEAAHPELVQGIQA